MPKNEAKTPSRTPSKPSQPKVSHTPSATTAIILAAITAVTSIATAWITTSARAQPAAETAAKSALEAKTVQVTSLKSQIAAVQKATAEAERDNTATLIPKGTIVAWAIKAGPIPSGWHVCNGDNGTPNLVGMFLRGVGTLSETGPDSNSSATHKHIFTTKPSTATVTYTTDQGNDSTGVIAYSHAHGGETDESSNIPPNYKVVYIMKM